MRCHICDKILSKDEVNFNRDHQDFNPCGVCLKVINSLFEPKDEIEMDKEFSEESESYEIEDTLDDFLLDIPLF